MTDGKPAMDDIRQMYIYHQYFQADKVALVYPGEGEPVSGRFMQVDNHNNPGDQQCGLLFIRPHANIRQWQKEVAEGVGAWIIR